MADPALRETRRLLLLDGVHALPLTHYRAANYLEELAARQGRDELSVGAQGLGDGPLRGGEGLRALVRHGQPLTIVRDRMGHADVETTERYLGRYRSDRDRVVPDMGVGASLAAAGGAVVIPMRRTR